MDVRFSMRFPKVPHWFPTWGTSIFPVFTGVIEVGSPFPHNNNKKGKEGHGVAKNLVGSFFNFMGNLGNLAKKPLCLLASCGSPLGELLGNHRGNS